MPVTRLEKSKTVRPIILCVFNCRVCYSWRTVLPDYEDIPRRRRPMQGEKVADWRLWFMLIFGAAGRTMCHAYSDTWVQCDQVIQLHRGPPYEPR